VTGAAETEEILLEARGIWKYYPGTIALKGVDFRVHRGQVNVLVGENGAGKSTLMKILAGVETPSEGRLTLEGKEVRFEGPREALARGIGIIYQELNLFPNLSIAENLFANREKLKFPGWIDHRAQSEAARVVLDRLKQDLDPSTLVRDLKVGQQQLVEIAKALSEDARLLIMDEPTSALSQPEVEVLFHIIDELKKHGVSIIYISHRLEELIQIGDTITVLRDGSLICERPMAEVDLPWIVANMVGQDTGKFAASEPHEVKDAVLKVRNLTLAPRLGKVALNGISFELRAGEILGIYGLLGSGRSEVLESIMGIHEDATGELLLGEKSLGEPSIRSRIRRGVAMVPEDRQREGLIQTLSVAQNGTLAGLWRLVTNRFHIVRSKEKAAVAEMVRDMSIKVASPDHLITSLSGGNQQKVVIGKSLLTQPRVLMLDEPTRGIDVGAKAEVFRIVNNLARRGIAILFVTSEIKELLGLCDRILVLSKGNLVGDFSREEATQDALIAASASGHLTTSQRKKGAVHG
jgi:erythritol transport system ATP-binding protein